jgi:hypothetical protein
VQIITDGLKVGASRSNCSGVQVRLATVRQFPENEAMKTSWSRLARVAAVLVAGSFSALLSLEDAFAAPTWERTELSASLGLLALQCDAREFCFAIACPDRKLQLINISPGGGPFGNPDFGASGRLAILRVGKRTFTLSFTWDDSILDVARAAGSRSELPPAALAALAENDGKIEGTNTGPVKATIFSRGLKQRWPAIASACGLPEPPRR